MVKRTLKFLIISHVGIMESGAIFKSFPYSLNLLETFHVVAMNDGTESENPLARKNFYASYITHYKSLLFNHCFNGCSF